jgi:hypothetical protein
MIPTPYSTLPGFRTVYAETDLFQAIAISEVMALNGQGGSNPGGATLAAQNAQTTILTNTGADTTRIYQDTQQIQPSASNISLRIDAINQILTRIPIYTNTVGIAGSTTNNLLIAGSSGNRIYITEISLGNQSGSTVTINLTTDGSGDAVFNTRLLDGGNVSKTYSPGREFRMETGNGLRIQGNVVGYTFCIGYFIAP